MKKQSIETVEHRLRDTLKRRGYRLIKSRRRDAFALGFGQYMIVDAQTGFPVEGGGGNISINNGYELSLDDVEAWLAGMAILRADAIRRVKEARQAKAPAFRASMPVAPSRARSGRG